MNDMMGSHLSIAAIDYSLIFGQQSLNNAILIINTTTPVTTIIIIIIIIIIIEVLSARPFGSQRFFSSLTIIIFDHHLK